MSASTDPSRSQQSPTRLPGAVRPGGVGPWLLIGAILLLSFNLRSAVTSLGAVLDQVQAGLGLSSTLAGLLTTLPVLCFAGMGAASAALARRFGVQVVLAGSMLAVVTGTLVRALTESTPVFFAATVLALAGMATGNVLVPASVKAYFPHRIGLLTAAYTVVLAIGTTVPAALTAPITEATGSWRTGIGIWTVTAAIAALPWLGIAATARRPAGGSRTQRRSGSRDLVRSPVAWALAIFFGLQSTQAYAAFGWLAQVFKDAGVDPTQAGILLSVLPIAGIPMSVSLPTIAARLPNPWALVVTCGLCYLFGYSGLLLAPAAGAWAWVILIGLGGGSFPLALTLIGMRSRDHETTARLSGFVQSVGYLLAAIGPLAIGALYGATGGWTVPIGLLAALVVPQVIAGVLAARPRFVDGPA